MRVESFGVHFVTGDILKPETRGRLGFTSAEDGRAVYVYASRGNTDPVRLSPQDAAKFADLLAQLSREIG